MYGTEQARDRLRVDRHRAPPRAGVELPQRFRAREDPGRRYHDVDTAEALDALPQRLVERGRIGDVAPHREVVGRVELVRREIQPDDGRAVGT